MYFNQLATDFGIDLGPTRYLIWGSGTELGQTWDWLVTYGKSVTAFHYKLLFDLKPGNTSNVNLPEIKTTTA